jgi:tetratricopeptide (TPR) repeat protein
MAKTGVNPAVFVLAGLAAASILGLVGYLYLRPAPAPAPEPVIAAQPAEAYVQPAQLAARADAYPNDPAAWAKLCAVTARNYWRDSSLADCDHAVELQPAAVETRLDRAFLHLKVGKPDQALEGFQAVLKAEPANPKALFGRSLIRVQMKEVQASAQDRREALARDPDVVRTLEQAYDFKVPWDYRH